MRVALITDGITPYVLGGMQRHSYYLVKYLSKNGIYVDLFHFNQSDLDIQELDCFNDDEKKYIDSYVLEFPSVLRLPGHYLYESYLYSKSIFELLIPQINTYDFIYTKGFSGWKLLMEKAGGLKCPPVGVNFHGFEMFQNAPDLRSSLQHYMLRPVVRYLTKSADVVFSYGGEITGIINQIIKNKSKVIEIPAAIDGKYVTEEKHLKNRSVTRFVYVGRYERRKGVEELNGVLKDLLTKCDFQFHFVGPIPEDKKLKNEKIIYHGQITRFSEIQDILKQCDVLVCPSHSEGMPNVILEGMASGLAIIGSKVGAVEQMVNNSNGCLIYPGSRKELKEAMLSLILCSNEEILSMQNNSIRKIKTLFNWERTSLLLLESIKNGYVN